MSSFNSQYNSVPISVTPILPFPLLSSPFFSAPISLFIFPPWSYINQHTHMFYVYLLSSLFLPSSSFSPRSCLCYIFPRIAFFCFVFVRYVRLRSTATLFSFFLLPFLEKKTNIFLCFEFHVTWIDFSRDTSDHILSLWRDSTHNPLEWHALRYSKDHSHPAAVCLRAAV